MRSLLTKYILVSFLLAVPATPTSFHVTINTSSVDGEQGGIYLGFFPGNNAGLASVGISNFLITAPGALSSAPKLTDGDASGTLNSGNLTIGNADALNDYLQALTFGSTLSFTANFTLPSPLVGSSGSEFDVEITGSDLITPLFTSDPDGYIVRIAYDQSGVFTAEATSSQATVASSSVPEPSFLIPIGLLFVLFASKGLRRISVSLRYGFRYSAACVARREQTSIRA